MMAVACTRNSSLALPLLRTHFQLRSFLHSSSFGTLNEVLIGLRPQ